MNKRNKIKARRKVIKFSATFFALLLVLGACKKEETEIGSDLQDANLNLVSTDTVTIITYSELEEEVRADERAISLLGAYHDPIFGKVNCGIVTQIVPEAFTQDFPGLADVTMDSVVLALRYSSINYYANLDEFSVEVFEIDDVLQRDDQEYLISETPTFDESADLVLDGTMPIDPDIVKNVVVGGDTLGPQLRIHLDPQVGLDLIADSQAGLMNENFQTNTFKGLYIRVAAVDADPAEGEGTVLYFNVEDVLSKMTIYYTALDISDRFDFDINTTCARYNKIDFDRSGTNVQLAIDDQSVGEEVFYTQGAAIRGVIEIPYIENLFLGEDGQVDPKIINQVELVLPIQDFQPDPFDPSISLYLARPEPDGTYEFTEDYSSDVFYDEPNREFRFSMTREIQALLNGDIEKVAYRVYAPAFFASTIERVVFNGTETTLKEKPRLEITYTEY